LTTTVLCDLDGVLYRGAAPIPGASTALGKLIGAVESVLFITNNSTRTPEATAEKIIRLTGVEVGGDQVLTSAQAAATMLDDSDGPILVVGEDGLRDSLRSAGFEITEAPDSAGAVVVGLTRSLSYDDITHAMQAIRGGARFVATNDDTSFPTEDGLAPGCGAIVAAIAAAAGASPEVAGKPNPAMRDLIRSKVNGDVWVIGDRLDTDIALAAFEPGWRSILVLTGITGRDEASDTPADEVVDDFPAAVDLVLEQLQQS
jgi:4-nitrophenyl phosphatase